MKDQFRRIPLFRRVLLFSFFITFVVVAISAAISYYLQEKQLENQLADHALDVATLWSSTIDPTRLKYIIELKDDQTLSYKTVEKRLSAFNENNSYYIEGYILDNHIVKDNQMLLLIKSQDDRRFHVEPFSSIKVSNTVFGSFRNALSSNKASHSGIYKNDTGTWLTVFSPIKDDKGETVAVLGIDIDATAIKTFQKKYMIILSLILVIISFFVYFIFRMVLKKTLKPVNELITGMNEVRKGNFDVDIKVTDKSELSALCEDFNKMTKQLSILFDKLSATSAQMGSIPHSYHLHTLDDALDEMEIIMEKTKNNREMQRAEKMNAIGQLAASVAHEIRNPMTVVKGFLQIFLAKDQMSEEERMYIRLMIDEMNRAETIINDYLSLAKPDLEHTERIMGSELSIKVLDLMNSYAMLSKNITIVTPFLEEINIKGNKSELQQVLINILKNGIEAMKDGGVLTLNLYREGHYGVFEISDTGVGMTQDELQRLGTAFYSLKEKGTGMGLTVCYQIIERMKGKIEVVSEKGIGTTFKIYVPIWDDPVN
jgi:two-component system, sporulation sensor kinase B